MTFNVCQSFHSKERTIRIPGGGEKIPPKKFVQRKMPGKTICAAITSEKKNRASKQQVQIVLKKNSCRG
jgi:hypothetical protein